MKWCILICLLMTGEAITTKYVFTRETASQCKEHIIDSYDYTPGEEMFSKDRQQYKLAPDVLFEMHLAAQGRDSWIRVGRDPIKDNSNKENVQVEVYISSSAPPGLFKEDNYLYGKGPILSSVELRPYYIRITNNGRVQFGKECEEPEIEYTYSDNGADVKKMKYFNFSGGGLRILYDCPVSCPAPPVIINSESYLKKKEGSKVDLPCRIQEGNPEPSITWFFMKKGTTGYVQMNGKTGDVLQLTNVLVDNEGHYKCEAKNTEGRAEHIVQLEVGVFPEIEKSESYLKKKEGSKVDLPCRIQKGNPKPSITWFFMKKGTSGYVQMNSKTGDVLQLTNVLVDNEGHYKCEAKNTEGRAEHIVQLEVGVFPEIEKSQSYFKKKEGSKVDLPCRIQKGNPKPSITWLFMKKGTSGYVQMNGKTGDVLQLTNVLVDNEGHYKCEAKNTEGRAEHIVQLEVGVFPEIEKSQSYFKKKEGSKVDLPCRIRKGNPKPSIIWFFMKKGTSGYVQMNGKTGDVLQLTNVLVDNEGHYKCEAKNTEGRAEHIVQLEVGVFPEIEKSESYLKKKEGSKVDLPCRIQKGNPKPSITWLFMKKGTSGYVQMNGKTGDVLQLTNVLVDNEGHYKCEAKNTEGRAEHIVQLEVGVFPEIEKSESYLKKKEGSKVDLPCRIQKGNPKPSITWFFMKKGTTGYVQMNGETGDVLQLTNVLVDNEGHYKCEAKNTEGRAEHIVQLEVGAPPVIINSETYLKKKEGSKVDLPCRIQKGNPKPSITWFFMKKGTTGYVQMNGETGEVLQLTNVLVGNEGYYKCEAKNTEGRAEHIVHIEIRVKGAPEIYDSAPYIWDIEGSTVDVPCRIQEGKPKPSITWFFMKKGTTDYVQMKDKTDEVLHLTNVLKNNKGLYKCVAENTLGRAEHIVELGVERFHKK